MGCHMTRLEGLEETQGVMFELALQLMLPTRLANHLVKLVLATCF